MLKDVGAEMKVKSLDSAGWGEAVNNADDPPASGASSGCGRRRSTC